MSARAPRILAQPAAFSPFSSLALWAPLFPRPRLRLGLRAQPSCAHNLNYWRNGAWHAFGNAAASHIEGVRFSRPRRLADYAEWVKAGAVGGYPPEGGFLLPSAKESAAARLDALQARRDRGKRDRSTVLRSLSVPRSHPTTLQDTLMLGMRLSDGIDLVALRAQFGGAAADAVASALHPFAPELVRPGLPTTRVALVGRALRVYFVAPSGLAA